MNPQRIHGGNPEKRVDVCGMCPRVARGVACVPCVPRGNQAKRVGRRLGPGVLISGKRSRGQEIGVHRETDCICGLWDPSQSAQRKDARRVSCPHYVREMQSVMSLVEADEPITATDEWSMGKTTVIQGRLYEARANNIFDWLSSY